MIILIFSAAAANLKTGEKYGNDCVITTHDMNPTIAMNETMNTRDVKLLALMYQSDTKLTFASDIFSASY